MILYESACLMYLLVHAALPSKRGMPGHRREPTHVLQTASVQNCTAGHDFACLAIASGTPCTLKRCYCACALIIWPLAERPHSLCCPRVSSWATHHMSLLCCSPRPALVACRIGSPHRLPHLLVSCIGDERQARCVAREAGALRTRDTMGMSAPGALSRVRLTCDAEVPGGRPQGCIGAGAHHRIGHADEDKQPDAVVRVYVYLQPRAANGRPEDGLQQAGQDLRGAFALQERWVLGEHMAHMEALVARSQAPPTGLSCEVLSLARAGLLLKLSQAAPCWLRRRCAKKRAMGQF